MARTLVGESGWLLACPVSPMWAIARVPLSNPPRLWSFRIDRAQGSFASRQPTGAGVAVAGAPAGAEAYAPWRRRERPGGPP